MTFASPLAATSSLQVFLTVVPQSTVDTSPTGLPVTVDNVQYTAPATFTWTPGSKHTLSAVTPITQDYTR